MRTKHEFELALTLLRQGLTPTEVARATGIPREIAGIHCTRASRKQIAVYSKAAVARLDEFVGPKT